MRGRINRFEARMMMEIIMSEEMEAMKRRKLERY
jgi:hypothetical protein